MKLRHVMREFHGITGYDRTRPLVCTHRPSAEAQPRGCAHRPSPEREDHIGSRNRTPRFSVRDSGLLHVLLGIRTERDLLAHPKGGASWEGYAVEAVISELEPDQAYFWATHQGAELDLLLFKNGRRLGLTRVRLDTPRARGADRIAGVSGHQACIPGEAATTRDVMVDRRMSEFA